MDWKSLLTGVNLIWTTIGLAIGGLSVAFGLGVAVGRWPLSTLKREKDEALSEVVAKERVVTELEARLRQPVPTPSVPLQPHEATLPPESVQVWLRPLKREEVDLTQSKGRVPVLLAANLKGGVAKTMVAANLATYFATRSSYPATRELGSKRVLLVDLDYQGSLSRMMLTAMGASLGSLLPNNRVAAQVGVRK